MARDHNQDNPDGSQSTASATGPRTPASFREELSTEANTVVDDSWAGSAPAQYGVTPRVLIGKSKWFNVLWLLPIGFVLLITAVGVAKGLRSVPTVVEFISEYPGRVIPPGAEGRAGFPAWIGWQHFFNMLLLIPIIRAGITILADHPRLYWTRHSTPGKEWFRMQTPIPADPL
ncbi:hypothetical protein [Arthrobacter sp. OAP107]|uniref:hypothetical protein n=1 Tax=Arthrobacter sp. OAP107 TaxID=3156445 RepID=UPI0033965A26